MSEAPFHREQVTVLEKKQLYQGFHKLQAYRLQHPLFRGGYSEPLWREVLDNHNAVGVLLFDPTAQCIVLVEQFRIGAYAQGASNPWLLELVAGLVDNAEDAASVAQREAREEAGCEIEKLEHIADYFSSPGNTIQKFSLYCGLGDFSQAQGVHGLDHEGEDIRVHRLSLNAALQLLKDKKISNAHTMVALQWLQLNHARLTLE